MVTTTASTPIVADATKENMSWMQVIVVTCVFAVLFVLFSAGFAYGLTNKVVKTGMGEHCGSGGNFAPTTKGVIIQSGLASTVMLVFLIIYKLSS